MWLVTKHSVIGYGSALICLTWRQRPIDSAVTPTSHSSNADVLKLLYASESPGGLVKHSLLGLGPRVSDSVGLGGAREFAFLTGFLVMPRLLIHCSYISSVSFPAV